MNLRQTRSKTSEDIAKGRFIAAVLKKNARVIDADIQKRINRASFNSSFWSDRSFIVSNDGVMTYKHRPQHRFVDMKTRQTNSGIIRKKRYRIHNNVLFGHANNILRELAFGFTKSIKEELMQLDGTRF